MSLLDSNGYLRLLPSSAYDALDRNQLRLWCHHYARYGLPTIELIDWLKEKIKDSKVIEIGAGSGDLCHHLGIRGTDNKCQTWPDVSQFYSITGQPTISYPSSVEEIDALSAIEKYQPDIVVASWVTHWIDPNLPVPPGGGNMYGIKEDQMVDKGIKYIMIGNESIHGSKPIMRLPHETHTLPFVRSRSAHPELDRIYIWN